MIMMHVLMKIVMIIIPNSIVQSPSWKATRYSYSQQILHVVFNMKIHYHIQKIKLRVPILGNFNPAQAPITLLEDLI
jgi:hypothetical protein